MQNIDIIAVGKMRDKAMLSLWQEYLKRLQSNVKLYEISDKLSPNKTNEKIAALIKEQAFLIVLDERGKSLSSQDFTKIIQNKMNGHTNHFQFVIGGADGHTADIRDKADLLLGFGAQTWPHMLIRIMLVEQIYRTQQILKGHPYHRE